MDKVDIKVNKVKTDIIELKTDIAKLKTNITEIKTQIKSQDKHFITQVNNIKKSLYNHIAILLNSL